MPKSVLLHFAKMLPRWLWTQMKGQDKCRIARFLKWVHTLFWGIKMAAIVFVETFLRPSDQGAILHWVIQVASEFILVVRERSRILSFLKSRKFDWTEVRAWDLWFEVPALLPTELSSPILMVPQIVKYLCFGWGASQRPLIQKCCEAGDQHPLNKMHTLSFLLHLKDTC